MNKDKLYIQNIRHMIRTAGTNNDTSGGLIGANAKEKIKDNLILTVKVWIAECESHYGECIGGDDDVHQALIELYSLVSNW